eukprot:365817-Chlamydomonas_euryale.AAC.29
MHGVRARVTGSGPIRGMYVLSAARQRGSSSGLSAVTTATPLQSSAIRYQPHPANRDMRTGRRAAKALSRHAERSLPTTPP